MSLLIVLSVALTLVSTHEYHKTWSVKVRRGTDVDQLAKEFSMINLGQIGQIEDHYLFEKASHPRRSRRHAVDITSQVESHHMVLEAAQQRIVSRQKRSIKARQITFSDPHYPKQWYLKHSYNNVTNAWTQGVTGRGVVVTILDDGLEYTHPDLQKNYEPKASADLNDNDDDPMPRYDITNENKHGTRCAGEVSSVANNNICGVGAAYNAKIGGVRMLDGDVTDAVEAKAIGLNPQFIDIYSASWGPDDDGQTVDGPGKLTKTSFTLGIEKGRNGLGSIFVWASGNGGMAHDNCNCDGYTNSIWTLSIGSASELGEKPWYAEECSSTMAVTYSSGSSKEQQIYSTDLHSKCTEHHTGTSAAAPLAAGIFALVLQANPTLTWRDMQHLVISTSKESNLKNPEWVTNGVGRKVSHKFGFGVIDAGALVTLAGLWNNIPDQRICRTEVKEPKKDIQGGKEVEFVIKTDGCRGDDQVMHLEHVQAVITMTARKRGDISLALISPMGTRSQLLTSRKYDSSSSGFTAWPFLTVHKWGEDPDGKWTLVVRNNGMNTMELVSWSLNLHGTKTLPKLRNTTGNFSADVDDTSGEQYYRGGESSGATHVCTMHALTLLFASFWLLAF